MKYRDPLPITHAEAEAAFSSGKSERVCDALLRAALNDSDWRWVQAQCLRFITSPNNEIKAAAATSLGHLARIHRQLDLVDVKAALLELSKNPTIGGRAEDALDDIRTYIK